MIEPKTIEMDGLKFQLHPMPSLKALRLDKKVIELLIPILGGVKELSFDAEIDLGKATDALSESLRRMDDSEFEKFAVDLLSSAVYLPVGGAPQEMNAETINSVFQGRISLMYKMIVEIMRYNKFSPFELVGDGNVVQRILSSTGQTASPKENGSKSEKSDGLLGS
jgi:hypothetical protein